MNADDVSVDSLCLRVQVEAHTGAGGVLGFRVVSAQRMSRLTEMTVVCCTAADNVYNLHQVFDAYYSILQEPGFLSQTPDSSLANLFISKVICFTSAHL